MACQGVANRTTCRRELGLLTKWGVGPNLDHTDHRSHFLGSPLSCLVHHREVGGKGEMARF